MSKPSLTQDTPPILQVIDYRRVETLTDRPGSESGICVITHEGASFILEMSAVLGLIIADELARQWKPAGETLKGGQS